ncbi:hypothetical protein Tco_0047478 [Tanacetum coccineum]
MGGFIAQTRSKRASKHSYDSPLPGDNTPGSDEERIEQDDLMNFVPPTPHDSPLSGSHTPGSDEGRPNINELMAICTNLSDRVLALEQSKTAQDLVIRKLKKKVRKLEKKLRARTLGMKLFKISTSKIKSLDEDDFAELDVDNAMENVKGDAQTQGRNIVEQTTTTGDTVNTASIDVSAVGPSNVSTTGPSTIEKEYPLTRGTLGLMMVARLLVEADSEMSKELLRKIFYQANRPRINKFRGVGVAAEVIEVAVWMLSGEVMMGRLMLVLLLFEEVLLLSEEVLLLSEEVVDLIHNGSWVWPMEWMSRFHVLNNVQIPILVDDKFDEVVWETRAARFTKYATRIVWNDMYCNEPKVSWKDMIWFPQCIPSHSFVLWMAVKEQTSDTGHDCNMET